MGIIGGVLFKVSDLQKALDQPLESGVKHGLAFSLEKARNHQYEEIKLDVGLAYIDDKGIEIKPYNITDITAVDLFRLEPKNPEDCEFEFNSFLKKSLDIAEFFVGFLDLHQYGLIKSYRTEYVMLTGTFEHFSNEHRMQDGVVETPNFPDSWFTLKMEPFKAELRDPDDSLGVPFYYTLEACPSAWATRSVSKEHFISMLEGMRDYLAALPRD